MPGAGDFAFFVELAIAERGAHVGAEVVDGEIVAVAVEEGDQSVAEMKRSACAWGNGADLGDGDEIGHGFESGQRVGLSIILSM